MFRKCFLHVGNPHSGSTSIQGALFDHAALLHQHGFLYPSSDRNHGALAADKAPQSRRARAVLSRRHRSTDPEAKLDDICATFRAGVEAEMAASDAHTLILSSEFFCTLPEYELRALDAYLKRFAEEVVVVCYVRHPYAEYLTRIQHRVKRGRGRIDGFSRDQIQGNIIDRLDRLVDTFGRERVVFRPFERPQLYKNDVVADFLHIAGAGDELIGQIEAKELNVSPSHEAILIADALIGLGVGEGGRGEAAPAEMRVLSLLLSRVRGTRFGFDAASTESLLADARPQAERLRTEYGLDLSEPSVPSVESRWSEETLKDLAEVIWELSKRRPRGAQRRAAADPTADDQPVRRGRGRRAGMRRRQRPEGARCKPSAPADDSEA